MYVYAIRPRFEKSRIISEKVGFMVLRAAYRALKSIYTFSLGIALYSQNIRSQQTHITRYPLESLISFCRSLVMSRVQSLNDRLSRIDPRFCLITSRRTHPSCIWYSRQRPLVLHGE